MRFDGGIGGENEKIPVGACRVPHRDGTEESDAPYPVVLIAAIFRPALVPSPPQSATEEGGGGKPHGQSRRLGPPFLFKAFHTERVTKNVHPCAKISHSPCQDAHLLRGVDFPPGGQDTSPP